MSYILEALKKLERKRRQEETRPTLSLADTPDPETPIRPLWIYLVALGLMLNAGLFFWWLFHPVSAPTPVPVGAPAPRVTSPKAAPPAPAGGEDRSVFPPKKEPVPETPRPMAKAPAAEQRPAVTAERVTAAGPRTASPPAPSAERSPASRPVGESFSTPPVAQTPATPSGTTATPSTPVKKAPVPTPVKESPKSLPGETTPAASPVKTPAQVAPVEKTPGPEPAKKTSTTPMKKEVLRDTRVYNLNELPADIRNALPPLKISAHVYSPDPSSRLAQVNGQMVQQGQDLIEGIKVEEILPKGIIFRFQGYRFEIGIQ